MTAMRHCNKSSLYVGIQPIMDGLRLRLCRPGQIESETMIDEREELNLSHQRR